MYVVFKIILFWAFQYTRPKRKCFYCQTLQSNLKKHLFRKHKDQDLIKDAITGGTKHDEARVVDYLLKAAMFDDNCQKEKAGEEIIPVRKQGKTRQSDSYVICGYCRGTFRKPQFWKHQRKCLSRGLSFKSKMKMSDLKLMRNVENIQDNSYFTQALSKIY